jgi:DNA-binding IclR family transcriptional regulator
MENNEISEHLVRIFKVVRDRNGWMSARDVAVAANVSGRTARAHCLGLVRLGIFDQAEVFPGHRYRLSTFAEKRNVTYLNRLRHAACALGIELEPVAA